MGLTAEQARVCTLLKETITMMCKSGLTYNNEFSIEALIGITLDKDNVILISLNEQVQNYPTLKGEKNSATFELEHYEESPSENEGSMQHLPRKKRKRHRPRESLPDSEYSASKTRNKSENNILGLQKEDPDLGDMGCDDVTFIKEEMNDWIDDHDDSYNDMKPSSNVQSYENPGTQKFDPIRHSSGSTSRSIVNSSTQDISQATLETDWEPGENSVPTDVLGGTTKSTDGVENFGAENATMAISKSPMPSLSCSSSIDLEEQDDQFQCQLCHRSFSLERDLDLHVQAGHRDASHMCHMCGVQRKSLDALRVHMEDTHTQSKRFHCTICSLDFARKVQHESHMNKHLEIRPFSCPMCDASFYSNSHLLRHKKTCKGNDSKKPSSCTVCQKNFSNRNSLKEHMNAKHSDTRFFCTCGKDYDWKRCLRRHQQTCSAAQLLKKSLTN